MILHSVRSGEAAVGIGRARRSFADNPRYLPYVMAKVRLKDRPRVTEARLVSECRRYAALPRRFRAMTGRDLVSRRLVS